MEIGKSEKRVLTAVVYRHVFVLTSETSMIMQSPSISVLLKFPQLKKIIRFSLAKV